MYDRDWARSTVENHRKSCTRAQQINLCIQQLYDNSPCRLLLIKDIQDVLIDSLQGKGDKALWVEYKRLCRKTPLDKELLEKVARKIFNKVDVEKLQRQFVFD